MTHQILTKKCSKCKEIKPISAFYNKKESKDGYYSYCKKCFNLQSNRNYQKRRQEVLKKQRQYYKQNTTKILERCAQYRQEHKTENHQYQEQYRQKHRMKIRRFHRQYFKTLIGRLRCMWRGMNSRCTNPKSTGYKYYGGRGIKVEFASFDDFYDYVVNKLRADPRGLTIDRIDNDGNYKKGTIRFVTKAENNRNRKRRTAKAECHTV
jgi:hypothetical protein